MTKAQKQKLAEMQAEFTAWILEISNTRGGVIDLACQQRYYGNDQIFCDDCNTDFVRTERVRVKVQNARTAALGLPAVLELWQWLAVLRGYDNKCAYCGGAFEAMDHVVPVAKGGGTVMSNVVPACTACNLRKLHRDVSVMFDRIGG